jgi:hypothetical protein
MAVFGIRFEDPLREVTRGVEVKTRWDPGGLGSISLTNTQLTIKGSSRLSLVERYLTTLGILWGSFFEAFFQLVRERTRHMPTADILKVSAAKPTPPKLAPKIGKYVPDHIIRVFAEEDDGSHDILLFTLFRPLGARPALWLFWGFLTQILSSDKLELQTQALREEVGLETHCSGQEEMRHYRLGRCK